MKPSRFLLGSDLLFFLLFFPLLFILMPVDKWLAYRPVFLCVLVAYIAGLYVFYRQVNIPGLFIRRRFLKGAACLSGVLLATVAITAAFDAFSRPETMLQASRNRLRIQSVWFLVLTVTGYCFSNNLLAELFKQEMLRKDLETAKRKAELALYKSQISPHFLLNTLNTLYGLLITRSEQTQEAFERFIGLVKYANRNARRDFIPLGEEADYLTQYVELQRLRHNDRMEVSFSPDIEDPRMPVPPMLFVSFVENAFKYGISSDEHSPVRITLRQRKAEGSLLFRTENRIFPHADAERGRTGIENCRKRLQLLYPGRHRLDITAADGLFRVELTLDGHRRSPCAEGSGPAGGGPAEEGPYPGHT